jgi:signal transduction histidine kinase
MRSLRTWLALGLVLAIALPAAAGAAAWLAAGEWQAQRRDDRLARAQRLLEHASIDTPGLAGRLSALGVEAQLDAGFKPVDTKILDAAKSGDPLAAREAKQEVLRAEKAGQLVTPGLETTLSGPGGKRALDDYIATQVGFPALSGTLFTRREGVAPRLAAALAAAAIALAAALALAVGLLRRWVLRPLAVLSGDAERIAGGELETTPVRTRAREVAQVSDALHGMAGALGSALGAQAAAERDRRFLVSAIAHDLRTPLFTLRGSLEAIERGIGDGDALTRAQRKADHLDRLVGDLFAFSRAEYAREAHTRDEVDLAELVRRAVEPGPIAVEVVGEATAHADPVALQRVMTNLLDNAVRHARARVRVEVRAAAQGDGAAVVVADDGPGFAPEDLPRVFEPLYRGDKARGGGGAGLGLAIARRLVRAHGGDVEAANRPEGGASVTVTLPCPSRSPSITSTSSHATARAPASGS